MPNIHSASRSDAVAIGTDYFTLRNLGLSLSDAFSVANVQRLVGADMVEIKGYGVAAITTIRAPLLDFVGIQPVADARCPFVGLLVDALSIARRIKAAVSPRLHLFWCELSLWSSALTALIRTELCGTFGFKCLCALGARELLGGNAGPWRHPSRVSSVALPCKPDIFEATYELAPIPRNRSIGR